MPSVTMIVRERQLAIRRELDRRAISLKVVAYDSRLPYDTLRSYFPGGEAEPATIPGSAIYALCGAIPGDLLSLLLPEGFLVVRAPEGVDHDAAAEAMEDYLATKNRAHHRESEDGREIGPSEEAALNVKLAVVRAA